MKRRPTSSRPAPPSTNRGVQNTTPLPFFEALVDWCAFTVSDFGSLEKVLTVLNVAAVELVDMPKGGLGYRVQKRCGHLAVFMDGKPDMGIHVEISGQGCREFDGRSGRWRNLFASVFSVGGHFTRVDVALDDRAGYFSLSEMRSKMERREIRSRFKEGRDITSFKFTDAPGQEGKTLYFGSVKSDAKIRFYDKAFEQGVDGFWLRTEIECRHDRANTLAQYLTESDSIGIVVAGVLKNYLAFIEPSSDSNKARWPVSSWWEKFLGAVERLSLSVKKPERTIERVQEWFEKQVSPTLALLTKYFGGDLSYFEEQIHKGASRLKPYHMALISSS